MKTLTFNEGTIKFPPKFESLGFNKINDIEISLLAEEMLYKYSPYFFNKYKDNKLFIKNVWIDLKPNLPKELQKMSFPMDFENLFIKMETIREIRKGEKSEYNKSHKKEIEEEKLKDKEVHGYCYKDGNKVELSNTMVEQSRWFISRGDLCGRWVSSVIPEDVEVNTSDKNYPCIEGHSWKKIEIKDTDSIATYKINIGFGKAFVPKAIWISANSEEKQNDTEEKFEHALALTKKWSSMEKSILSDLESKDKLTLENACISYLISTFGIRIGNEKGEDNIRDKTYGASTLLRKHIKIDDNKVSLDFSGKDSVRFVGTKKCNDKFVSAMNSIITNISSENESLFKKATSSTVSEYLKQITKLDFMSPKLCRTTLASLTLAKEIQKKEWSESMTDKQFKNQYDECCLTVSKLLNHQKTVEKDKCKQIDESSKEKLKVAKSNLKKLEKETEEKLAKFKDDRRKANIKFTGKTLKEKIAEIKEKENKVKERFENAKVKFNDLKKQMEFRMESKESNIGTARNSYSNPKIVYSLCEECNKEPTLVYTKAQLSKFEWASDVTSDYWKNYPKV